MQEMAGHRLTTTRERLLRPDPSRLEERFAEFRAAG